MTEESYNTRVRRNENDLRELTNRVSDLEKESWTLSKDSQRLEEILLDLKNIVNKLDVAITKMQLKPAESAEQYKSFIWTTVIGIIIAYLMGKYM